MMLRKEVLLVVLAVTCATYAAGDDLTASEVADLEARASGPAITSENLASGGVFSLETRNIVPVGIASQGGPFQLAALPHLKAESDVFSDGFESGATNYWSATVPEVQMPSGAVVAFELEACPSGWTEATTINRGRALVGLAPGGTRGVSTWVGDWDGDRDTHGHQSELALTTDVRTHNHQWGMLVSGSWNRWRTYDAAGGNVYLTYDIDGFGAQGEDYYPLAANPTVDLFTKYSSHSHSVTVDHLITAEDLDPAPNVQLRFCRKN